MHCLPTDRQAIFVNLRGGFMIIRIVGWFWVITGVLFLLMPGLLRNRIQKKSNKVVRRYLFAMAIFIGAGLISIGMEISGAAAKIVMVIALIALVKGVFMLKSKAANSIIDFFKDKPISVFRIWAGIQIAIGALILL